MPHLEAAVRIDPHDSTRHINLGSGLAQSGRYQDAVREYETAIPLASDPEVRFRCYETIATLYGLLGDYAKVRETYWQALQVDPAEASQIEQRLSQQAADENSGPAYLQLGLFLDETGKPSEARSAFAQALKLDPALEEARRLLGIRERKQPQGKE